MLNRHCKRVLMGATILQALAGAASAASLPAASPLVTGNVDDSVTVTMTRDLPGALAHASDAGVLDGNTLLGHIRLQLRRPPALQAALDTLTRNQTIRGSADYHKWLKPADLRQYGPAQSDIDRVTA